MNREEFIEYTEKRLGSKNPAGSFELYRAFEIFSSEVKGFNSLPAETIFKTCYTAVLINFGACSYMGRRVVILSRREPEQIEIDYSLQWGK